MMVYRCISAFELTNMYKGIDGREAVITGKNTFTYLDDMDYIHFFRYSQFANYYFHLRANFPFNRYVLYMVADIPKDILNKYMGYGFYRLTDFILGDEDILPIPEYAIPSSLFKKDYVLAVNNYMYSNYTSDDNEYYSYFCLLRDLGKKYHYDFDLVTSYLLEHDLDDLINQYSSGIVLDDVSDQKVLSRKIN